MVGEADVGEADVGEADIREAVENVAVVGADDIATRLPVLRLQFTVQHVV